MCSSVCGISFAVLKILAGLTVLPALSRPRNNSLADLFIRPACVSLISPQRGRQHQLPTKLGEDIPKPVLKRSATIADF